MASLDGVRIPITGGTSGLGRAMAGAVVATGANRAVTGRDGKRTTAVAAAIGAVPVPCDVTDEGAVAEGVAAEQALGGRLASPAVAEVHDERIVAVEFDGGRAAHERGRR